MVVRQLACFGTILFLSLGARAQSCGVPGSCGSGPGVVGYVSGKIENLTGGAAEYAQIGVVYVDNPSLLTPGQRIDPDAVCFVEQTTGEYCIEFTETGRSFYLFTSSAEHFNVIVGTSGWITEGVMGLPLAEDFAGALAFSTDSAHIGQDFILESNKLEAPTSGNGLPLVVYFSKKVVDDEFSPYVLLRTGHPLTSYRIGGDRRRSIDLARYGYNVVLQNLRGYGKSKPLSSRTFFQNDAWIDNTGDGVPDGDGYKLIEWLADNEALWSADPRGVGVIGASNEAINQYLTAGASPDGLTCGYLMIGTGDLYRTVNAEDRREVAFGSFQYGTHQGVPRDYLIRGNPANATDGTFETVLPSGVLDDPDDPFWLTLQDRLTEANIPILHIGGWYDTFAEDAVHFFRELQTVHSNQLLVMGPWDHFLSGPFPAGNVYDIEPPHAFFDEYLMGRTGTRDEVRYFVTGCIRADCSSGSPRANTWQTADAWPPIAVSPTRFFLHDLSSPGAGLRLATPASQSFPPGTGDLRTYDSDCPLPSWGGPAVLPWSYVCQDPTAMCLPFPGSLFVSGLGPALIDEFTASTTEIDLTTRSDTWTYATGALPQGLEVTGEVVVHLAVSSLTKELPLKLPKRMDWVVRMVDVYPANGGFEEQWYALRETSVRWKPGVTGLYHEVELRFQLSHYFEAGHQIAIHIANSSCQRLEALVPENVDGIEVDEAYNIVWIGESSGVGGSLSASYVDLPIVFGDPTGL